MEGKPQTCLFQSSGDEASMADSAMLGSLTIPSAHNFVNFTSDWILTALAWEFGFVGFDCADEGEL
jgi:hypothetical protein